MNGPWEGLSLWFIRSMLGQAARFSDANAAREVSGPLRDGIPPTGGICWYETEPHGNVALSIGQVETERAMVLCVRQGWPALRYYDEAQLGKYLGWTERVGPAEQTDSHRTTAQALRHLSDAAKTRYWKDPDVAEWLLREAKTNDAIADRQFKEVQY